MKKYTVIKAFSVLEKALLIPEDEIYAEQAVSNYRIFNAKTRKYIGAVSQEKFEKVAKEANEFKIYDNEESKKYILDFITAMRVKARSPKQKDDLNFISSLIIEKF